MAQLKLEAWRLGLRARLGNETDWAEPSFILASFSLKGHCEPGCWVYGWAGYRSPAGDLATQPGTWLLGLQPLQSIQVTLDSRGCLARLGLAGLGEAWMERLAAPHLLGVFPPHTLSGAEP